MKIQPLNPFFRLLDILLTPFMWILSGMKWELPQETHPWHGQRISENLIPKQFQLKVVEQDLKAKFHHGSILGLYHMPIFGGLTRYIVVEANGFTMYWHIGWKLRNSDGGREALWEIQRLPVHESRLRLLAGVNGIHLTAVNEKGEPISLKVVGRGTLGDGQFPGIRLL